MDNWNDSRRACLACQKCGLADTRTHVVFGVGRTDAEVLFVGEGPGENEDLTGEPFVGKGGKLLANIVKCRPPHNRDPLNTEQEACMGWLRRQIELIDPKIIVCLGRIAAMVLIKPDFKITKEHGQWFQVDGREVMALFHPAALLRDPRRRPETFEDLKALERKIQEICDHTY